MNTTYVIALLIALVACATDLKSGRIPNVLTFGGALAALVFHGATGGSEGLLVAAGGWVVGAAIFFLPFALGGLGAGDVKLLAALGAWLGPADAVWLALYSGVAGGALALSVALARGYLRQALANLRLLLTHWRVAGVGPLAEVSLAGSQGPRLAYAVPILVGTLATVWLR
jgi:prepilin peptidase CpaA